MIPEQVEELSLPTRPTKTTDSRSRNFKGGSVEVDAIPPAILRNMVSDSIERHIDQKALARTRLTEAAERDTLARIPQEIKVVVPGLVRLEVGVWVIKMPSRSNQAVRRYHSRYYRWGPFN